MDRSQGYTDGGFVGDEFAPRREPGTAAALGSLLLVVLVGLGCLVFAGVVAHGIERLVVYGWSLA